MSASSAQLTSTSLHCGWHCPQTERQEKMWSDYGIQSHKNIFPSGMFIIYTSLSLDGPFFKSCAKWILHHGKQTSNWKGFHAWMLSFCSCLDIMAATSLCIIKGTGVCHLHQTLASPREPPEKASAVTVETSSFLDSDSWRLRQPGPKRGLV